MRERKEEGSRGRGGEEVSISAMAMSAKRRIEEENMEWFIEAI